jgi:hypothetical protein
MLFHGTMFKLGVISQVDTKLGIACIEINIKFSVGFSTIFRVSSVSS